jgi:hypothetical protein
MVNTRRALIKREEGGKRGKSRERRNLNSTA